MVIVAQTGKFTKTHWIIHLKWENFLICKICLNRVVSLKKEKKERKRKRRKAPWEILVHRQIWEPLRFNTLILQWGNWNPERKMIHPGSHGEFIQSHKASDLCLCKRKWRARVWPGEMNQRGQPTSMSQSILNLFPHQIAGSQLVWLEWSRKGAQEAAGGQWKDHKYGVKRPEFKSKRWELMVTLGSSFHLPESHLVHPPIKRRW